ncbi:MULTISPECIES: cytochrome c oxidase subunit II [Alishewanella]|uniref:Cytochrome c oxidase subunit 2 n=1 Tax=Alishewanella jeotgali KCTC 22429 TaxID=1129374 RepID=H3ZF16_9ALTE|nr:MULTISPECIES: cytochrome c oxidase subunit II [Alishewanella]EHR40834.1 Cytochrome c oxidase subunit II [Alishewanella jeotgali KCTC 22429]MCT8125222.1 cytochrome c oxidase subunit II [Alishewanella sp. BS5-314]
MPLNMTRGVTEISQQVYQLHMTIFWICCVIGAVVFGIMFWSIIRHRKARGVQPAQFHESTKVEILWTAIPVVILIGMAIPATKTLIAMEDTSAADVTVLVTGSQWKWHYKYLDHEIEYFSLLATPREQIANKLAKGENYLLEVDRPLVIPTGKKVRFLMTSDDVIHSWWVPAFAVKKDANPGFINEAWTRVDEPGIYRGQCAELCGKDHGFMPVVVIAKEPADYQAWVVQEEARIAAAKAAERELLAMNMDMAELMATGERVYQGWCVACHQASGNGLPGIFPAIRGSQLVLNDRRAHIDIIVNGKPGTAMQAFGRQLSLKELAAVITYTRNAFDNNTGDAVQAADVYAVQQGKGE